MNQQVFFPLSAYAKRTLHILYVNIYIYTHIHTHISENGTVTKITADLKGRSYMDDHFMNTVMKI